VLKEIAKGPHSRVFLAEKDGQQVALKELLFALVPEAAQLDGFEREARLLAQLDHPSIPKLVESFREGEGVHTRLYLAQQFVKGRSLLEQMQSHRFDEREAKALASELLAVLEYLHGLSPRVIHRDLKPANVMRRDDGSLALVDFGAARDLVRGVTHGATLVGTFGYMPPEQLGGTVDVTADLYALGATLIHLLSRKSPDELLRPGMELSFDDAVNVSDGLRGWLKTLTQRERSARFQSAPQALEALDALKRPRVQTTSPPVSHKLSLKRLGVPLLLAIPLLWGVLVAMRPNAPRRAEPTPVPSAAVTTPMVVNPPKVARPRQTASAPGPTAPGVEVVTVPKAKAPVPFTLERPFSVALSESISTGGGALEVLGVEAAPGSPGTLTLTSRPGAEAVYVELLDQLGNRDPTRATLLTASKTGTRTTRFSLPPNSKRVQLNFGPQANPLASILVDLSAGTASRAH
jgi:serine/threonine-protein kinase